jgi:plasmid stabilization system protein ParE
MDYYEQVATAKLADEFYAELRSLMAEASAKSEYFSIRDRDIRRANLHRFPYHFLFRIVENVVRVPVVRHHSRHPAVGTERR